MTKTKKQKEKETIDKVRYEGFCEGMELSQKNYEKHIIPERIKFAREEMVGLFEDIIDSFVINRRKLFGDEVMDEVLDFDWTDKIKKHLRKQLKETLNKNDLL